MTEGPPAAEGPPHPLRAGSEYFRAHGLGNDYLVFEAVPPFLPGWLVDDDTIRRVCDRWRGVGSDGVVVLLDRDPEDGVFPLRMFNPDGSEFERSGNGLRILAAYLHGEGLVSASKPFVVRSGGSVIPMSVHGDPVDGLFDVSVEMGRAMVGSAAVGLDAARLDSEGRAVHPVVGPIPFVPVSVGNPHAVVFADGAPPDARGSRGVVDASGPAGPRGPHDSSGPAPSLSLGDLGPFLATHPAFPRGTNVQLVDDVGPGRIRIRIWERGVGPTSASGTSSCAAAVAAVATGRLSAGDVRVEMEGGVLEVGVTEVLDVTLRGPVEEISRGRLAGAWV